MQFLTARWKHLLMINYVVSSDVLQPYVPNGTRLDTFEEQHFVSLVAFVFDEMRVLGFPVPGHRCFEEVNLRFYVAPEHDPKIRAVTFLKEFVPRKIIPWVANNFFGENYEAIAMTHQVPPRALRYAWGEKLENHLEASQAFELDAPDVGSLAEFITEHYWGYTAGRKQTLQYQVQHPQWEVCELDRASVEVDFAASYGEDFGFLSAQEPHSMLYCHGSKVAVSFPSYLPSSFASPIP